MTAARARLHFLANAVNPVPILAADVEKHEAQVQELRSMVRAARWVLWILTPVIAIATGITPLVVRYAVRDAMAAHSVRSP